MYKIKFSLLLPVILIAVLIISVALYLFVPYFQYCEHSGGIFIVCTIRAFKLAQILMMPAFAILLVAFFLLLDFNYLPLIRTISNFIENDITGSTKFSVSILVIFSLFFYFLLGRLFDYLILKFKK